jgi:hypothetical protein
LAHRTAIRWRRGKDEGLWRRARSQGCGLPKILVQGWMHAAEGQIQDSGKAHASALQL